MGHLRRGYHRGPSRYWTVGIAIILMGMVVAIVRANEIASGGPERTIAALGQVVPGLRFTGFAAVSFAIARTLG